MVCDRPDETAKYHIDSIHVLGSISHLAVYRARELSHDAHEM
jgi:hypothetical protein